MSEACFLSFIPPLTAVLRDGKWQVISSHDLVPGDIIRVKDANVEKSEIVNNT